LGIIPESISTATVGLTGLITLVLGWFLRKKTEDANIKKIGVATEKTAYDLYVEAINKNKEFFEDIINLRISISEIRAELDKVKADYQISQRLLEHEQKISKENKELVEALQQQIISLRREINLLNAVTSPVRDDPHQGR